MTPARHVLILSVAFVAVPVATPHARLAAQAAQAPQAHPSFSGTWTPVDREKSDTLFSVGLSVLSGESKLSIEQRPDRFTVTFAQSPSIGA